MSAITGETGRDLGFARVNWRQVGLFVGLTFGLTWLLDLALWATTGYASQSSLVVLQLQMLLPAFSAILLGLFVFPSGAPRESSGRARVFFAFFLVFTLIYVGLAALALVSPSQAALSSGLAQLLTILGLLFVVGLRLARGKESFALAGLSFGKARHWLVFGVGLALFYCLQTLLNYAFGTGRAANVAAIAGQAGMPTDVFLAVAVVQSALISPFLALLITFGEEYGWRGFLQGELVKLGRVRGVLLVGVIWGLWHAPIIAMGHNYPGYPVAGIFLMVVYCVLLAFVLGYAVLKSGSVWLAAFLHAVNNQVYSTLVILAYTPRDPVFSFGAGIFGLATAAVVVALILRDPIWRK